MKTKNSIPLRKSKEAMDLLREIRNKRLELKIDEDPQRFSRIDLAISRYIKSNPKAKDFIIRSRFK